MKLAIVSPQFPFSGRVPLVPPILEYLAALTLREAPETTVQLFDANQLQITPQDIAAETVAISVMTATAPWAYSFADDCRKQGKQVIMGGIHPTALPDEAALHADSVVVGEAESIWGKVLTDVRQGSISRFYHGERQPLDSLPMPIDGKLKGNYQFRAFFTMRGCPYRCTFCSVRKFYGDTIRYRPISSVVEEVETCAGKLWFNGDDNIWGGDLQRSVALFDALAQGSKRHWYGFGDLRSIQGVEGAKMLATARRSGLFSVWVGWESDEQYLGTFNAVGKQGANREDAVRKMQDAGIDVTLFVVLGGRQDSIDSFKRTLELSERLNVGIHPVLLTPLPGTELYDAYREYLLPGLGWDAFTGVRSVFQHPDPQMSPQRREEEYHRLSNELFRFERIVSRIGNISAKGFPTTHIYSFAMQIPMKHALSKAYEEWKSVNGEDPAPLITTSAITSQPHSELEYHFGPGHGAWIAIILAITTVHIFESIYFETSIMVDRIEAILFLSSFLVILFTLLANRKTVYGYFDTLINWTRDGRSRKFLCVRQSAVSASVCCGQLWGHFCTFYD
jgi:radical SAM superfamily enzyme YgiQ (UPF0313 family)